MTANPLVINPDDEERVSYAKYRIGAIGRYIEQCAEEGIEIAEEKLRWLDAERDELIAALRRHGLWPKE